MKWGWGVQMGRKRFSNWKPSGCNLVVVGEGGHIPETRGDVAALEKAVTLGIPLRPPFPYFMSWLLGSWP